MIITKTFLIKCFICGFSMCIPGMSGGSTAVLFGIYNPLISTISDFFKDTKKNTINILLSGCCVIAGTLLFSVVLGKISVKYDQYIRYLSAAIVILSIPIFIKKSSIKRLNTKKSIYIFSGFLTILFIDRIIQLNNLFICRQGNLIIFTAGLVLSVALILPGISFTYMLYFFGLYSRAITALPNKDFGFILAFASGVITGIVIFSKLINNILTKHPVLTDCILCGTMLASALIIIV